MTTRRRIGIALAATVVVFVAAGIGRSAWRRALEPHYEGRTAGEWLDYLATFSQQGSIFDEDIRDKGEIAFRSLGKAGQRQLILEYLSFERPTSLQTNLYAFGEKLPPALRPPFVRSPVPKLSVCRELLSLIRPPWEVFQPEITDAFAAGGDRALAATMLLGYVGRGGTNAAPLLVSSPTNAAPGFRILALQALTDLKTNSAPALPTLLSWAQRWSPGTPVQGADRMVLNAITASGEQAGEALEKLDQLFAASVQPADQRELATALLRINPGHAAAFAVLEAQLKSGTNQPGNLPRDMMWIFLWRHGAPNPAFSRLASTLIDSRAHWFLAAQVMLRNDPAAGVSVLHERLSTHRFDSGAMGVLDLLLRHDAGDEVALRLLNSQVRDDFFPRNQLRMLLVQSYRHCLPDSPGVVELLKSIQPAPDDEALRKAIRDTLRHIELNGKLKELRARDAAGGR